MLDAKRLGLAGGVLWGVSMFIMTLLGVFIGYGVEFLNVMSSVYPGFSVSFLGSFLGLVYGFLDGFTGFFLIGWLYNRF